MNETPNVVDSPDIYWGEDKHIVSKKQKRTSVDITEYGLKTFKKECQLCGETFETRSGRAKYCPGTCRRISRRNAERKYALKKNGKIGRIVGDVDTCPVCGEGFMIRSQNHKYCDGCKALNAETWRHGYDKQLGIDIDCVICGKTIKRTGSGRIWCPEKCQPPEGVKIKCLTCEEEKDYSDFYDYRGVVDGKFIRNCRKCHSAKVLEAQRKNDLNNQR